MFLLFQSPGSRRAEDYPPPHTAKSASSASGQAERRLEMILFRNGLFKQRHNTRSGSRRLSSTEAHVSAYRLICSHPNTTVAVGTAALSVIVRHLELCPGNTWMNLGSERHSMITNPVSPPAARARSSSRDPASAPTRHKPSFCVPGACLIHQCPWWCERSYLSPAGHQPTVRQESCTRPYGDEVSAKTFHAFLF